MNRSKAGLGRRYWLIILGVTGSAAAACGDDGGDAPGAGIECGPGTVLSGRQCVVAAGGSSNGGTDADASAGDSLGSAAEGPTGSGGGPNGQGGAVGGAQAQGGSSSGDANGGEAFGGDAGAGPTVRATRWLAYSAETGVYAYDMEAFPDATAIQLATSGGLSLGGTWSPDGSRLLYSSNGGIYVRDMRGEAPSPARLLGSLLVRGWSGDSESLLVGFTAGVIDASQSGPIVQPLPSGTSFAWAPSGNLLAYQTNEGLFVVQVASGVPGVARKLSGVLEGGSEQFVWSPDAKRIAYWSASELVLIAPTDPPKIDVVTQPVVDNPSVDRVSFSADGSRLAFFGHQTRENHVDLYYVDARSPQAPKPVYETPPAQTPADYRWHPGLRWLLFWNDTVDGPTYEAVNLSAPSPSPVVAVPPDLFSVEWMPGAPQLVGQNRSDDKFYLFDPSRGDNATAQVLTAPAPASYPWIAEPAGKVFAYPEKLDLLIEDLAGLATPVRRISFLGGQAPKPTKWAWSPDSRFLAASIVETPYIPDLYTLQILRTDGLQTSSPVVVQAHGESSVSFAWQP